MEQITPEKAKVQSGIQDSIQIAMIEHLFVNYARQYKNPESFIEGFLEKTKKKIKAGMSIAPEYMETDSPLMKESIKEAVRLTNNELDGVIELYKKQLTDALLA